MSSIRFHARIFGRYLPGVAALGLVERATAHGGVSGGPGDVGAVTVILATAGVGLVAGLYGLYTGAPRQIDQAAFSVALGIVTVLVGASILVSVVTRPTAVVGAGLVTGTAYVAGGSGDGHPLADGADRAIPAVAVGVSAHRVVEGALLGTLVGSGRGLAVAAAVLVAAHAAVEMAVVSGYYRRAGARYRGVATVGVAHACFVGTALTTASVAQAVPGVFWTMVTAAAGALLVVTGVNECRR